MVYISVKSSPWKSFNWNIWSLMEIIDPWYVTGFCDGESTFTYSRSNNSLSLYFAIKLNVDDRELLYKIKDFFGVGKMYVGRPIPPRRYSGHTRTHFYYRVSRIKDLDRIIEHFTKYPLVGKKAKSFAVWKEMVNEKKSSYRKPQREKLNELASKLSFLTGKNTAQRNAHGQNNSNM